MNIPILDSKLIFPDVNNATPEGIVAIGGDLNPKRLLLAYQSGIFPWYSEEEPIIWWSPDPRFVLFPQELKISKSMQQLIKRNAFEVTYNKDFNAVISNCRSTKREYQDGTWITDKMIEAYQELYSLGYIMSVEVWQQQKLVGGLYGVLIGKCFFGESMFHHVSNASKYGFIHLVEYLKHQEIAIIDCQVYTQHLESLGAKFISRTNFIKLLNNNI